MHCPIAISRLNEWPAIFGELAFRPRNAFGVSTILCGSLTQTRAYAQLLPPKQLSSAQRSECLRSTPRKSLGSTPPARPPIRGSEPFPGSRRSFAYFSPSSRFLSRYRSTHASRFLPVTCKEASPRCAFLGVGSVPQGYFRKPHVSTGGRRSPKLN